MILQTKRWLLVAAFPFLLSLTAVLPVRAADAVANVRLYAIDCGRIGVSDMSAFADTGELDGKPASVVASCFLIRHPKGTLLWDTGLSDKLAENKGGVENGIFKLSVTKGLVDQLKTIDISPSEITFLAFSHLHFDHTGNANAFDSSTWILNKDEVAWAEATPTPRLRQKASEKRPGHPAPTRAWHDVQLFDEQHQAAMLDAGDAVGEASAEAARPLSGVVILSGDLYHSRANRKFKRVPRLNVERADTLASIDRVEKIVKNTRARFIVQHDVDDFASLPRFPAFLE